MNAGAAVDVLKIEHHIGRVMTEYAWLVDHGQARQIIELCADPFQMKTLAGVLDRTAFAASLQRRELAPGTSRHVFSNIRIVRVDPGRVRASLLMAAHRIPGSDEASERSVELADWDVEFVSQMDWLIAAIDVQPV